MKVGDTVQVIRGEERDSRGKILSINRETGKVLIEGVNRAFKHVRRSQRNPQGGRLEKEMPVDISNVMLIDPKTNEPTRVGVRVLEDGSKERFAKKSGASLGVIAPANPRYAKKTK